MSNPSQSANVTQRQVDIFRRLAAREAARRQQLNEKNHERFSVSLGPGSDNESSARIEEKFPNDLSILQTEKLQTILQQEKAKNDIAWAKVRERVHRLDHPSNADGNNVEEQGMDVRLREKRLELDQLDFEIQQTEKYLEQIEIVHESQQTDEILALLTRSNLASAVEQYEALNASLQNQIEKQKDQLIKDDELLRDLGEISIGLRKRKLVLEDRMNNVDFASIEGKLLQRVDNIENELSWFLQSLIEISSKIFEDDEGLQQAQLRHLIDSLINKAWDTPIDPYVDVSQDYLPAISAFLLRANIAIEHPRDSHRIRLIDFHRLANE